MCTRRHREFGFVCFSPLVGNRSLDFFEEPPIGGGRRNLQNLESSVASTSLETSSREFKVSDHPFRAWSRACAILLSDTTAPRAQTPAPSAVAVETNPYLEGKTVASASTERGRPVRQTPIPR